MTSPQALHSAKTPNWGTTQWVIEAARELLGWTIDLDPGSSHEFNQYVLASRIITEQDNALIQDWYEWACFGMEVKPLSISVFVNPPGGLVNEFWRKLIAGYHAGQFSRCFWVGFSVEQLCTMASEDTHPLDYSTCVLRKRLSFIKPDGSKGGAPSHGNYVTALGVDHTAFMRLFTQHGKVTRGDLALDIKP